MLLLAIDTALAACSVAVFDTEAGIIASDSQPMVRGHAEALMPQIARVMHAAATRFAELDRVIVTVGPGSFTGLRVGVAAARGIALASSIPAIGITTLDALTAPEIAAGEATPVLAAIDARNGQVYMQACSADGEVRASAQIALADEVHNVLPPMPVRIVGSAAALIASMWPENYPPPAKVDVRTAPDIAWVARLGAMRSPTHDAPKPFYLRAPDARPQHAARIARQ